MNVIVFVIKLLLIFNRAPPSYKSINFIKDKLNIISFKKKNQQQKRVVLKSNHNNYNEYTTTKKEKNLKIFF